MGILKERLRQRAAERVVQERATQPIVRILPSVDQRSQPTPITSTVRHVTTPTPEPEIIDPLARRLSQVLRDESVPEIERVRLRQIVSLVLADRRRS